MVDCANVDDIVGNLGCEIICDLLYTVIADCLCYTIRHKYIFC